jgi:hypothetical protein
MWRSFSDSSFRLRYSTIVQEVGLRQADKVHAVSCELHFDMKRIQSSVELPRRSRMGGSFESSMWA